MTQPTASEVRKFLLEHLSLMIAANGLNPAELAGDFDLLKAGVIDSLGVLEMISAIEHRFKITVDFEPLEPAELTVLDKFCTFVAENAAQSESSS